MGKYTAEEIKRYKDICKRTGYDAPGVLKLMEDPNRLDDTPLDCYNGIDFDEALFFDQIFGEFLFHPEDYQKYFA